LHFNSTPKLQNFQCVKTLESNRDVIVGIKVRLDRNITDDGRNEHELYLRAKKGENLAIGICTKRNLHKVSNYSNQFILVIAPVKVTVLEIEV
jgi:hypothetical protein